LLPACSNACTDQQRRQKGSQGSKGRGNKNKPIPGSLSFPHFPTLLFKLRWQLENRCSFRTVFPKLFRVADHWSFLFKK
jgi:hypothetical protein